MKISIQIDEKCTEHRIIITLVISICYNNVYGGGEFYPVPPDLTRTAGSELNAVIPQTACCGLIGGGCSAISVIWNMDFWSLAKQSGSYFTLLSLIMLPASYFLNWMPHTLPGILSYIAIYAGIFLAVWLGRYFALRAKIRCMNQKLHSS